MLTRNMNRRPGMYKRPAATFFPLQRPTNMQSVEHLKILMNKRSHTAPKANRHFWQLHRELEGRNILH